MIDFYTKESFVPVDKSQFKGEGWYFWIDEEEVFGPYKSAQDAEVARTYHNSDGEDQFDGEILDPKLKTVRDCFAMLVVGACVIVFFLS